MKEPRNEREAHAALMRMPALHADVLGDGERTTRMSRLIEFVHVFLHYSKYHGIAYAAKRAYGIAFKGLPF